MSGFSQVLPAVEKGARMKLIGTAGQLALQTIYTTRSNIKTVKDLEDRYMQDLNIRTGIQKSILAYAQVADMSLALEAQKLAG
jgi:hypothetical protein